MKTGTLKFPLKICDKLFPAGTSIGICENADEYRTTGGTLNIKDKHDSVQVAILLPGLERPTIHHRSCVVIDESVHGKDIKC
jgi:hypothetical protein